MIRLFSRVKNLVTDINWLTETNSLLYRIQRQDKHALKNLYDLSSTKLLGLIVRIVKNKHEAEDVLQEVFIAVWQQAGKYTGSGSAWGWICVLARNRAVDRLRSLQAHPQDSTDTYPELLNQLTEINDLSDRHWIGQCLAQLKPRSQQAILMSCVQGYSHSELSEEMSEPLGTVKAWIRRGLQELKQCLAA
jgi:RNA polymerase sigma-70 factor (ECF subfamily)